MEHKRAGQQKWYVLNLEMNINPLFVYPASSLNVREEVAVDFKNYKIALEVLKDPYFTMPRLLAHLQSI